MVNAYRERFSEEGAEMRTTKPHIVPFAQKALRAVLAAVLAVSLAPAVPAFADDGGNDGSAAQALGYMGFPDVNEGDWYATDDMLGYAVDNGLLAGYDDGRFGPYDTVTRAQVATVLWRVAGEPKADAEDFHDVDYSQWYGAPIEWARSTRVVSGYGDTNTFDPEGAVTREQLAVMLANYAEKVAGLDASSDCSRLDAIAGSSGVSSWARPQMGWAVDQGILSGVVVDGVAWVDPQGTAQRCQVAKMASVFHRDVLPPIIDADYNNVIDYADDAIVVEDASYETMPDGSVSVEASALPDGVEPGDKVVLSPTAENPEGAALEVSSVSAVGEDVVISGSEPELDKIFDRIDVEGVAVSDDVEMLPADGVEVLSDGAGPLAVTNFGTYSFKYKGVAIKFTPSAEFKLDTDLKSIDEFYIGLNLDSSVSGSLAGVSNSFEKKLCDLKFPTNVPGLYIGVAVWAEVSVSGKVTLAITDSKTTGILYDGEEFKSVFKSDQDFSIDLSATARSGFDVTVSLNILKKPAIDASLGAGSKFKAGGVDIRDDGMVCADVESSIYASFGVGEHDSIMHEAGISWSKDLVDHDLATVHFENGNLVPECTWKQGEDDSPQAPNNPGDANPADDFTYEVINLPEDYDRATELFTANGLLEYYEPVQGVYITGYNGSNPNIVVPKSINGVDVVSVAVRQFSAGTEMPVLNIDVSQCSELRCISLSGPFSNVEFGDISKLEHFFAWGATVNGFIDVSSSPSLVTFALQYSTCGGFSVDTSSLRAFGAWLSNLTSLNLSNAPLLERVELVNNRILETASFENCGSLEYVYVYTNEPSSGVLSSLNVDGCESLDELYCSDQELQSLDISTCRSLRVLYCQNNRIADTATLENWLAQPGHSGQVGPQRTQTAFPLAVENQ